MPIKALPSTVIAAIKKAWPDGEIEEFDSDESYFQEVRESIERSLRRIPEATLVWQTHDEQRTSSVWDDDDELPDDTPFRSYHVFFVAPKGEEFTFTDETEDSGFDEETGEEDAEIVPGEGRIGCAVGVSLAAPVAAIAPATYSQFQDGTEHEPDIEPSIFSVETGEPLDLEKHYAESFGDAVWARLEKLRQEIAAALKKHRILVLDASTLELPVPNLVGNGDVFVQPPGRVRDAFFFRGV